MEIRSIALYTSCLRGYPMESHYGFGERSKFWVYWCSHFRRTRKKSEISEIKKNYFFFIKKLCYLKGEHFYGQ